jgi:hypothetical protein
MTTRERKSVRCAIYTRVSTEAGLDQELAGCDIESMMDTLKRAVLVPQHEIMVCRAFWRQILRQGFPLAASREHVEDGVEHFADIDIARPTTALGGRDHRRKHNPLRVSQITWITKAAPVSVSPMFRLPHGGILSNQAHAMGSHSIHSTQ